MGHIAHLSIEFFSNIKYELHFHLPHPTLGAINLTNLPLFYVRMLSSKIQLFLRIRFLNDLTLFLYFCDYLPFEEGLAIFLNKHEFSSPKDNLYQV
jgi:hypothetical protein